MSLPNKQKYKHLLQQIRTDYPDITLTLSETFHWDPTTNTIYHGDLRSDADIYSLFHELGHVGAQHSSYTTDLELLLMETAAWEHAQHIGLNYHYPIDQEHIDTCLDSYREWLHQRSRCPTCTLTGLERPSRHYRCINCGKQWRVSSSRFCRVYRQTKSTA